MQYTLPQFFIHCYIINHTLLFIPLISPAPCVPVDNFMLKKRCWLRTSPFPHMWTPCYSPFSFTLSTPHFPITIAISLFLILLFMYLVNKYYYSTPSPNFHQLFIHIILELSHLFPLTASRNFRCTHTDLCIFKQFLPFLSSIYSHKSYMMNCSTPHIFYKIWIQVIHII